jgi:hypothetical protein
MGVLRRLARWLPRRFERPGPSTHSWSEPAGIRRGGASIRPAAARPPEVTYSLGLDIGEVAPGYHLIARSVSLTDENLFFEYAFAPELTEEARQDFGLNMFYDADVSPPDWNYVGAGYDVQYARPPRKARKAWLDFFPSDYEWMEHLDQRGPDSDYLRNRIARLTVDLKTGEAQIEN